MSPLPTYFVKRHVSMVCPTSTQVDDLMTSVQRAFQYADLHPKTYEGTYKDLRNTWLEYGLLTFERFLS